MKLIKYIILIIVLPGLTLQKSFAQSGGSLHGNFQLDAQYYRPDSLIGASDVPEKMLMNGFANFIYDAGKFSAGLRYESYLNPLLGFDTRYTGSGITYRFLRYNNEGLDVTVGNFYEQFGSGIILRAYEERGLGYDNAFEGIRISYIPHPGITLKALTGKQRSFFAIGPGIVRGADAEFALSDAIPKLAHAKTKFILGGSFVSKYQKDQNPTFILPENVGAGSGRINIQRGDFSLNTEYARKVNDPSLVNNYIYKEGEALIVNANYSVSGFGISLNAKRIDNMNFRSDRDATVSNLLINYLPSMTKLHTYLLSAFYPYATQPNGEMGYQGEIFFNLKPESSLGGKYGTDVALHYSHFTSLDTIHTNDDIGYTSGFLKFGKKIYYEDFNIEVTKKLSKKVKTIFTYVYINYNKGVIQALPAFGHIYSNIGIVEINWKINTKNALRIEMQHMLTKQDQKSWAVFLAEYTIAPKWSLAAFDNYNYGNEDSDLRIHYYTATVAFTKHTNRFSFGYGKQRAGIFCVGGVCRNVPASNGITFSVTSSF